MKAISLTQPWATLVALGAKGIETRSWRTKHVGPLAIHAAKGFPPEAQALCLREPFRSALRDVPAAHLPRGAIVAVCELRGCLETGYLFDWLDTEYRLARNPRHPDEREFGDYRSGRWAWMLDDVCALAAPIPYLGMQGLWKIHDGSVANRLVARLDDRDRPSIVNLSAPSGAPG